jgi:outer membrane protein OmpA-like peptidoglycan-associated protein/tetratricopeptide (TPR) repeat protein
MKKYIFIISLFATQMYGQKMAEAAEKKYENIAYSKAIEAYGKMGEPESRTAISQMANSFRLNGDYENAEIYFKLLMDKTPDAQDVLHYAEALLSNGNCTEAVIWYEKFQTMSPDKNRSFIKNCDEIKSFSSKKINISPVSGLNSAKSEFSATPFKGGIVLTSTMKDAGTCKDNWTGESFTDLFIADFKDGEAQNIRSFGPEVDLKYHDGTATFNRAGNIMYFTRTNPTGKNALKQRDLKVFISHYKNGVWQEAAEMPFNSEEFATCHPTLSNDGKKLYFSSNRPGGIGGMDLWVSSLEYGRWAEPKNLGASVNTSGNEVFPFINDKNTLFFASNGHKGIGGLDIFSTEMKDGVFSNVENMGTPFNTGFDDFAYVQKLDYKSGFFSSNRKGGAGGDDIYFWQNAENQQVTEEKSNTQEVVKKPEPKVEIYKANIQFIDAITGVEIPKPAISIAGPNKAPSKEVGNNVIFEVVPSGMYTIKGEYEGYLSNTLTVEGIDLAKTPIYKIPLTKNTSKVANPYELVDGRPYFNGKSLKTGEVIEIQDIFYDYDKSNIRIDASMGLLRLAEVMLRYPTLEVELSSHTDSRGRSEYNQKLSQRRAEEAVTYLISRGIGKTRMSAKGFGESKLTNNCADGVDCSEEQHQRNRRTEVRVVKFEEQGVDLIKN